MVFTPRSLWTAAAAVLAAVLISTFVAEARTEPAHLAPGSDRPSLPALPNA